MNDNGHQIGSEPESPDVRVILVGRTGLDARLRLDPGVELVRVRTRLEAVGELSEPVEGAARSVVIVGGESDGEEPQFAQALRSLDPAVRVLGVGAARPEYDGQVAPDAEAETLRTIIRGGPVRVEPPPSPPIEAPRAPDHPARPIAGVSDEGDAALVRLVLAGKDPLAAAIDLIRRRLGATDVEFVDAAAEHAGPQVAWRGHVFGALRSAGSDGVQLTAAADWLASWLALRDQQAQLKEAAFVDPLTGAFNRRYFERFLGTALAKAHDERRAITVLVFDVDELKTFNDRYGHAAGDQILMESVRLLQSVIRPTDRVCRIGGDEFAVIFHDPQGPRTTNSRPPSSVFEIARRFQREVLAQRFPKLGLEAPGSLTVSGGLATYPWDGRTPGELLETADRRAMRSKREGKNAIRFGPEAGDVCGDQE